MEKVTLRTNILHNFWKNPDTFFYAQLKIIQLRFQ